MYSRPPNWNLNTGSGDAAFRKVEQGIGLRHAPPKTGTVEAPIADNANPNSFVGRTMPVEPESMITESADFGLPTVGNVAEVEVMESKATCHLLEATCTLELHNNTNRIKSACVLTNSMQTQQTVQASVLQFLFKD